MITIRRGEARDLGSIRAIQAASPEASQWNAADYLQYDLLVAQRGFHVAGFLAYRTLGAGEWELLNLAVSPDYRRQGVGRALLSHMLEACSGTIHLEVRPSNSAA